MAMTPEETLRQVEERIFAALRTRNLRALESELAEDFVHSSIGGASQDRAAFLAAVRDMPFRILEVRGEALSVRAFGALALLSGVQRARVALEDGTEVEASTGFVDVFTLVGGRWLLRHACSVELPARPSAG